MDEALEEIETELRDLMARLAKPAHRIVYRLLGIAADAIRAARVVALEKKLYDLPPE